MSTNTSVDTDEEEENIFDHHFLYVRRLPQAILQSSDIDRILSYFHCIKATHYYYTVEYDGADEENIIIIFNSYALTHAIRILPRIESFVRNIFNTEIKTLDNDDNNSLNLSIQWIDPSAFDEEYKEQVKAELYSIISPDEMYRQKWNTFCQDMIAHEYISELPNQSFQSLDVENENQPLRLVQMTNHISAPVKFNCDYSYIQLQGQDEDEKFGDDSSIASTVSSVKKLYNKHWMIYFCLLWGALFSLTYISFILNPTWIWDLKRIYNIFVHPGVFNITSLIFSIIYAVFQINLGFESSNSMMMLVIIIDACYCTIKVLVICFRLIYQWIILIQLWFYVVGMLVHMLDSMHQPLKLYQYFFSKHIIFNFDEDTIGRNVKLCFAINQLNVELFQLLMDGYNYQTGDNSWSNKYFYLSKCIRISPDVHVYDGDDDDDDSDTCSFNESDLATQDAVNASGDYCDSMNRSQTKYFVDISKFWGIICTWNIDHSYDQVNVGSKEKYKQLLSESLLNMHIKNNRKYYDELIKSNINDIYLEVGKVIVIVVTTAVVLLILKTNNHQTRNITEALSYIACVIIIMLLANTKDTLFTKMLIKFQTRSDYVTHQFINSVNQTLITQWCPWLVSKNDNDNDNDNSRSSSNDDDESDESNHKETVVSRLLLKHFKNMKYIVSTYDIALLRYETMTALAKEIHVVLNENEVELGPNEMIFPVELVNAILMFTFGSNLICADQLLRINKDDFMPYMFHLEADIMDPVEGVGTQTDAFVSQATKHWQDLIQNLSS